MDVAVSAVVLQRIEEVDAATALEGGVVLYFEAAAVKGDAGVAIVGDAGVAVAVDGARGRAAGAPPARQRAAGDTDGAGIRGDHGRVRLADAGVDVQLRAAMVNGKAGLAPGDGETAFGVGAAVREGQRAAIN